MRSVNNRGMLRRSKQTQASHVARNTLNYIAFALAACATPPAPDTPSSANQTAAADAALSRRLDAIARPFDGRVGVAFRVLETWRNYQLRGGERFPMASVYKFPIALTLLSMVDRGQLRLDEELHVGSQDLSIDHSPIAEDFPEMGRTLTIFDLVTAMIVDSDNTASDVLLRKIGGPSAVMQNLTRLGIVGMRVDRSELAIDADALRAARPAAFDRADRATLTKLEDSLTPGEQDAMQRAYVNDPRDTSTPSAIAELLTLFQLGRAVSPESTALLLQLMTRAHPRLSLKLPEGTPVAHKTGTGWGSFNDVGIITLPNGEHLIIALLLSQTQDLTLKAGDALVAEAARAVYDAVTH
jgi:beta-lactamase class A